MNNDDPRKGGTSASNAHADSLCPGRHLAQKGLTSEDSEDAAFGRVIHAALASRDPSKLTADQLDIYESTVAIETRLLDQLFGPNIAKAKVFVEQRFWVKVRDRIPNPHGGGGPSPEVSDIDVYYEHSGQPDRIYRLGPRGLIVEYKSLPGDVPVAATNPQLRDQTVLAARNLVLNEVMSVPIQPLVTHDPVPCLYDEVSIKQAEEEMFARVRRSNDPKSPRIAGDIQCKFCLARPTCKEYAVWAAALVPARIALPDLPVAQWSVEQRVAFCSGYKSVRKWIDDNEDAMKELLKDNPDAIPGFWLEPGDNRETVTDPQALFARFVEMGGTVENFMGCVKIVKGNLETRVRNITKTKGQGLKARMKQLLDGLVESKRSEPSLARRKE